MITAGLRGVKPHAVPGTEHGLQNVIHSTTAHGTAGKPWNE